MKVARLFSIAVTFSEGLMYSFPVTCKNGDYKIVQGLRIDDFSKAKMLATQKELEEERDAVAKILK
jgi:malate dehydrogenase